MMMMRYFPKILMKKNQLFPLVTQPKLCFQVIYTLITAKNIILNINSNEQQQQQQQEINITIPNINKSINVCLNMISDLCNNSKLDYLQFFVDILIYTNNFNENVIESFETIIKFNNHMNQESW